MSDTVTVNLRQTLVYSDGPGLPRERHGPGLVEMSARRAQVLGLKPEGKAAPAVSAAPEPDSTALSGRAHVETLGLPDAATQALREAGVKSVAAFRKATDEELLEIPGFGPSSLARGREAAGE